MAIDPQDDGLSGMHKAAHALIDKVHPVRVADSRYPVRAPVQTQSEIGNSQWGPPPVKFNPRDYLK